VARRGVILSGPEFAATYVAPGDPAASAFTYGRYHNPTWTAWEAALGEIEGGKAVAFASGMAAVVAVFGVVLAPGDIVVLPSDSYYTTRLVAEGWFGTMGIQARKAPTMGGGQKELLDDAKLLWLETPSNPTLTVCDLRELIAGAASRGVPVAVDNTTATAALQQPLALGATFSVASDTKALTGHSDLVLGHVACTSDVWIDKLRAFRSQFGGIPGPMEVWLAHRSLGTLPLRLARQCDNAEALATYLASHEGSGAVTHVWYPGLPGDPAHAIAARQMSRFGQVVSFELPSRAAAEVFLASLKLVREATSFGGIHSTAERRARWGGDAIGEGFIRFSCGCEATEDLLADVEQALAEVRAQRR
jgi:cystathionine gamma-lyase